MFFIVLINVKSGGNVGPNLLLKFKKAFELCEFDGIVVNLMDKNKRGKAIGAGPSLEEHKDTQDLRIIGCGGDGTIGWILSEVDKVEWGPEGKPPIGIVPLGTGNDLSRCLKWGEKYEEKSIQEILDEMREAKPTPFDRWKIDHTLLVSGSKNPKAADMLKENMVAVNNYFSIGVDAHVVLQFDKDRTAHPNIYSTRLANMASYAVHGGIQTATRQFRNMMNYVDCVVTKKDGSQIDVLGQGVHSILLLNIDSYAAGTNPWGGKDKASINDGLIEVISLSTYDLPQLNAGKKGKAWAQAKEVTITTTKALPIQIDGEPILLNPCKLTLSYLNEGLMLVNDNVKKTVKKECIDVELKFKVQWMESEFNVQWKDLNLETFKELHKQGGIWGEIIENKTFRKSVANKLTKYCKSKGDLHFASRLQNGNSYDIGNVFVQTRDKDPREYDHMGHIGSIINDEDNHPLPEFLNNPEIDDLAFPDIEFCCQDKMEESKNRVTIKLQNVKRQELSSGPGKGFEGLILKHFENHATCDIITIVFYADITIMGNVCLKQEQFEAEVKFEQIPFLFAFKNFQIASTGRVSKGQSPKKIKGKTRFMNTDKESYSFQPEIVTKGFMSTDMVKSRPQVQAPVSLQGGEVNIGNEVTQEATKKDEKNCQCCNIL